MISRGVGFMLLAVLFSALMAVCVKYLSHLPVYEIVFFRAVIALGLTYGLLKQQGIPVWGELKGLLLLRGAVGTIALCLYFLTIQHMPLASAVTLQYLSPIFASLLAIFVVRENVSGWQGLFFLLSFIGVALLKGVDHRISWLMLFIGVTAALFSGLAYNIIRKIQHREHPFVIAFYFPFVTSIALGGYMIFNWHWPSLTDWGLLFLVGIFAQTAQIFMTKAYQAEELSKVTILKYLGVVFAAFFGYVLFNETLPLTSILAIGLIMLGVILNVNYKRKGFS